MPSWRQKPHPDNKRKKKNNTDTHPQTHSHRNFSKTVSTVTNTHPIIHSLARWIETFVWKGEVRHDHSDKQQTTFSSQFSSRPSTPHYRTAYLLSSSSITTVTSNSTVIIFLIFIIILLIIISTAAAFIATKQLPRFKFAVITSSGKPESNTSHSFIKNF